MGVVTNASAAERAHRRRRGSLPRRPRRPALRATPSSVLSHHLTVQFMSLAAAEAAADAPQPPPLLPRWCAQARSPPRRAPGSRHSRCVKQPAAVVLTGYGRDVPSPMMAECMALMTRGADAIFLRTGRSAVRSVQ